MAKTSKDYYVPVRRIVTGNTAEGKSYIVSDGNNPHALLHEHAPMVAQVVWATDSAPATFTDEEPAPADKKFSIGPQNGGSLLRIVAFAPDSDVDPTKMDALFKEMGDHEAKDDTGKARHFFFHKTKTLDYAICLEGEIWALMDEGETLMRAGDVLIQRATNHAWSNRSDKVAKMAFVIIDAVE
jgi:hypothetical protein